MPSKPRSREFWAKHVKAWRSGGKTRAAYAKRANLNPHTLAWWAWRLGAEGTGARPTKAATAKPKRAKPKISKPESVAPVEFVELVASSEDRRIELELGDVMVRVPAGFDAMELARVLEVLEAR